MEKNKSIALGVLALLVVLLVLIVASSKQEYSKAPGETQQDLSKISPEVRVVEGDQRSILSSFPAGFPVEQQWNFLKGYRTIPANALESQYTVEYISNLSVSENAKIFKNYLQNAGFQISSAVQQSNHVSYYATKDNNDLSVVIVKQNDQVTVTASYLVR